MNVAQSFDPEWETKYQSGHEQRYPWDIIVSFVFRNYPTDKLRSDVNILEVGCGTGSNLWFASREGFSVTGVDGSVSAITAAQKRFSDEGLLGNFFVADFTDLPFDQNQFDLVIDRGSLVCCGFQMGKKAIREIYRVMRPGAMFFFNPYSDRHSSLTSGIMGLDGLTYDISEGSMVGYGQLCFYSRQQVIEALTDFNITALQHMECADVLQSKWMIHAEWRAIAQKPS
jgi:SAM-dependent methyltransferase